MGTPLFAGWTWDGPGMDLCGKPNENEPDVLREAEVSEIYTKQAQDRSEAIFRAWPDEPGCLARVEPGRTPPADPPKPALGNPSALQSKSSIRKISHQRVLELP